MGRTTGEEEQIGHPGGTPLEQVVRHHPDPVLVATAGEREALVVYVNDAFSALTGHAGTDVLGRSTAMLSGPHADPAQLADLHRRVVAGERVCEEVVQHRADGTTFWAEREVVPLRDGDGEVRWLLTVLRDVSARKRAEMDLERSRELRALATTAAGVGTWQWSPVTGEAAWDATTAAILGLPDVGLPSPDAFLRAVHPEDHPQYLEAMSGERPGDEATFRIIRPDGSVRHVFGRAARHLGPDGGVEEVAGVLVDVTDLRSAAELVADTLESISDAYCALDEDWRISYVNERATVLLGRARADLLGTVVWEDFPRIVGTSFELIREAMAERREVTFEEHLAGLDRWYEVRAFPIANGVGVYFRDITARHRAAAEREELLRAERAARVEAERIRVALAHQATHDALTGLVNRQELERTMEAALRRDPAPLTVLFIDLDRFKLVNDSLGHAVGDDLLRTAARRIVGAVRADDVVARLGGDEFVVLLGTDSRAVAHDTATRILEGLREPLTLRGRRHFVTASIGIATRTDHQTAGALLADGDVALYRAKDAGKDQLAWCDDAAREDLDRRVRVEGELREAIAGHQLALHYQPVFDLSSGRATGVEALLRWRHPVRGLLAPTEFVEVAEDAGLIEEIGDWVLGQAVADVRRWSARGRDVTVWVDLSARQLRRSGLAERARQVLTGAGVAPRHLGVQVTESALVDAGVATELTALSAMGACIGIDDFGTGGSSLAALRHLPVDVVKIDRSLVADVADARGAAMVQALVQLAHALGMTTVAQGIDEVSLVAVLRELGCDAGAGHALGRPGPAAATAMSAAVVTDVAVPHLRLVGTGTGGAGRPPSDPDAGGGS